MIERISHAEDRIARQLIELENNPQAAHDTTICNLHNELETLADELKTPALDDPHEAEPACQEAIKRIQTLAKREQETSAGMGQPAATSGLKLNSVIGQYQILAKVGQGGMGAVYRARHMKLDKIVALKVLPEDRLEKSDAVARFEREMKAVGKIEHPHLVRALDAGEAEGSHYLVMEYVDGIDLSRLLKEQGRLPVASACELVRQAALGLEAAHQSGMVHRDIKPANLMLARQDYGPPIVKVLDLGLARLSDDSGQLETELTTDNQIMGTLDFMAPEQAGSSRRVDARADVYSLGATLFTLLTGQPPFHSAEHQTIVQKLSALAIQPLPSLRALRADVPQGLVQVVEKMLAKDRENRYGEPGGVAEALKPYANNAGLAELLEDAKTVTSAIHSGRSTASWAIPSTDATIGLKLPRRPRWAIAAALLLALAPLLVLYAGTILRFTTNQGELVIEVDDPNIEVQVVQNGVVVKDKTKDREFTLTAMNGEVEVYEKDGVKLTTKEFQLTRGGKTTVRVMLEELADVRNAKAGPEKQKTSPWDASTKNFALEFRKDKVTLESLRYDGSHPLTIEAWVTPRQVHFDQFRVVFSSNAGLAMSLKGDAAEQTGFWSFDVWPPDYLKNPKVSPPLRLGSRPVKFTEIIGRPTHLAICLGDSRVALFINGQLAKQFEHEGLNSAKIQQDAEEIYKSSFLIGSGRGNGDSFDGRIDELRVSKVLRYGDNFTPAKRFEPDEHTLALYHFDEGSGDVLKDSSGNGHHGKISRAKWVNLNADREVAEWVLSLNGRVVIEAAGKQRKVITDPATLPIHPFQLVSVDLQNEYKVKRQHKPFYQTVVEDADLVKLKGLRHLATLSLAYADITDAGLEHLADLNALTMLDLHFTQLRGPGLVHLTGLKNITSLNLSGTRVASTGVEHLKELTNLETLLLGTKPSQFSDADLAHIEALQNLSSLSLYQTSVTDKGLSHLNQLKNLERLDLSESQVTGTGVERLQKALPKCKITWDGGVIEPQTEGLDVDRQAAEAVLKAGGTVEVWMRGSVPSHRKIEKLEDLPSESFSVKVISFSNVKGTTDESLKVLVGLKSLYAIYLHDTKVTDAGLAYLAQVPNLENANLHGTQITDAGLSQLAALPRLGMLSLSDTKVVTDGLEGLRKLPWVRELHLHGKMTKSRFLELAELRNLRRLYVSKESQVTEADVATFHEVNPDCRVFVNNVLIGADPVREVAETLHKKGATLTLYLLENSPGYRDYPSDKPLPVEPFGVRAVSFYKQPALMKDDDLSRLHVFPSLYKVDLSSTNVTDAGIEHLKDCRSVEDVWLHRTKITDRSLEILAELPVLFGMHVALTKVTNDGVAKLVGANSLRNLEISATQMNQEALKSIAQMPHLAELVLRSLKLKDDDLTKLYGMSKLRHLVLQENPVTKVGIEQLHQALPQCKISWDGGAVEPTETREADRHAAP